MRARHCQRIPVVTVLSGPAAGYPATTLYGSAVGTGSLVLLDMGGTSSDVTLVLDGKAQETDHTTIGGYDVGIRSVDVRSIGTGGGSIAVVDAGGLLRVGPQGAGADPGPACYRRGGKQATVTDAYLVIGRLNPDYFLGGQFKLSRPAAEEAIERDVASKMSLGTEEAACAIVQVATQNMVDAVRLAVLERGMDLRKHVLLAGGGAAGLHAAEIARDLAIGRALVPRHAAGLCALGMLHANVVHDYVEALYERWASDIFQDLSERFMRMRRKGLRDLKEEGFAENEVRYMFSVDMRYLGQQWEIEVPLSDPFDVNCIDEGGGMFHDLHEQVYGHRNVESPLVCRQVRLRAVGMTKKLHLPLAPPAGRPKAIERRRLFTGGREGFAKTPIFRGDTLARGTQLTGPALIEEPTTTMFVPKGWKMQVTSTGDYMLEDEPE